jgi:NTP pyrophosphatase (non-canonical NTP hydrolase)
VDFTALQNTLRHFAAERDWQAFHTPKNLAMALMVEAAELAEIFQWMTPEQSQAAHLDRVVQEQIADEVADVLLYLLQLADHSGIDLKRAVGRKLQKNAKKHPPTRPGQPAGTAAAAAPETHVLVDWENVQPKDADIRALVPDVTDLWVFHGPNQKRVGTHHASFGERATFVPIARTGKNALDFHLSFYMGYIASRRPDARFVVLSNDKGYGPMLEHAADLGFAARAVGFAPGAAGTGNGRPRKTATRRGGRTAAAVSAPKNGRPEAATAAAKPAAAPASRGRGRRSTSTTAGELMAAVAMAESLEAIVSATAPAPGGDAPGSHESTATTPAAPAKKTRRRAASKATAKAPASPAPAAATPEPPAKPAQAKRTRARKPAEKSAEPASPPAAPASATARSKPSRRSSSVAAEAAPAATPEAPEAAPAPATGRRRGQATSPAKTARSPAPAAPSARPDRLDQDVRHVQASLRKTADKPVRAKALLATIRSLLGGAAGADDDRVDAVLARLVAAGTVAVDAQGRVRFPEPARTR